jgi:CheY-like chemotaxis protein
VDRGSEIALNILVVAQQDPTTDWIQASLREMNYKLAGIADSAYQALQAVDRAHIDIILADSAATGVLEIEWIQRLAVKPLAPVVIVIATNSEMEFVRQAMLAGAQGFLLKPFDL